MSLLTSIKKSCQLLIFNDNNKRLMILDKKKLIQERG